MLSSPARLSSQGTPSRWDHAIGEGWREGCATLTLVRDIDGGLATRLENDPRCPLALALESFHQVEGRSFGQDRFLVRFHYVATEATYAPAWVVGDASVSFLEGRRNRYAGYEDEVWFEPITRCDSVSCAIPAGFAGLAAPATMPKLRGWMGATRGDTALTPWVLPADSASPSLEFRISLGWRPDSIVLGIGLRVVAVGTPETGAAGEAEERETTRTPGLKGGIRGDLLVISDRLGRGLLSIPLVQSLCGGRLVRRPSWMIGEDSATVIQTRASANVQWVRDCYGAYRGWTVRNPWRPDSGQRLWPRDSFDSAPVGSLRERERAGVQGVMVDDDLPLDDLQAIAGALGAKSVIHDTTIGWFVFDVPESIRGREDEVDARLSLIVPGGVNFLRGELSDAFGRSPALPILPSAKWKVSSATRRFLRTHLRAPVRAVEETLLTRQPEVAWVQVQFGDTLRHFDLDDRYAVADALRLGGRIGWNRNVAPWLASPGEVVPGPIAVRWPGDTLLLRALQQARGPTPSQRLDAAIAELRSGLILDPDVSREWLDSEIRSSYPWAGPDSLDAVACRRARFGPDWNLLLLLGRRGGTASLCAMAILAELRGSAIRDTATPREVLIYYATHEQELPFRDTLAAIAWERHDWAVFGAARAGSRTYPVIERLIHEFQLPPEIEVQECIGPTSTQRADACDGLVDHAIAEHQTALLEFLANRGVGGGPRMAVWMKVMRYLRGDPLRSGWVCYLPCS